MPEFDTSHVKNIVLLGHAGSGKTTLAECMLFEAGLITRKGSIAERNTTGDYHELEQERGNSIFSKLLHTKWRGYKINIIDKKLKSKKLLFIGNKKYTQGAIGLIKAFIQLNTKAELHIIGLKENEVDMQAEGLFYHGYLPSDNCLAS